MTRSRDRATGTAATGSERHPSASPSARTSRDLTLEGIYPTSPGLADGGPDPVATRILARSVARLLWEWAQAGRPPSGTIVDPGTTGRDADHD